MNEYNHHRIIERVASVVKLDDAKKQILKEASNFTDFFISPTESAKNKYFFYLFNYDITIKGTNTIKLNRITKNDYDLGFRMLKTNNSIRCMEKAGEKLFDGSYALEGWDSSHDEKEFFSSVNDRKRSPNDLDLKYNEFKELLFNGSLKGSLNNLIDTANQSDNVAFLHAMGAEGETAGDSRETAETEGNTSRSVFEDHLKKCFKEYLFLENEEEALFMLGIAFHGIMDSFTPSHMGFQKYTEQDMGLHAQGDVIPIMGFDKDGKLLDGNSSEQELVYFEPGQIKKESGFVQPIFSLIKHYDNNDFVNPVEYKMLRIFLIIGDIEKSDGDIWNDGKDKLLEDMKGKLLSEINQELGKKDKYRFGPQSYVYSEAAIKVISEIYQFLSKEREKCKSYAYYKKEKGIENGIIDKALNYWKRVYDGEENIIVRVDHSKEEEYSMKTIREKHIELSLYSKDQDLDKEYEKYKEYKEYKEWVAQQDIDRLNRLKG